MTESSIGGVRPRYRVLGYAGVMGEMCTDGVLLAFQLGDVERVQCAIGHRHQMGDQMAGRVSTGFRVRILAGVFDTYRQAVEYFCFSSQPLRHRGCVDAKGAFFGL